jgi:outer membrane protein OmpA-like peptidoglycan-associated protein
MIRFLIAFIIFFISFPILAQEELVQSVYFDTNKSDVEARQTNLLVDFIKKTDSIRIESIQIFGYCDDVGKDEYNRKLSAERAENVKSEITVNGIRNKIIVTIEGKGRILIEDDIVDNLPEVRSKNRRVDVVINLLPVPEEDLKIPGVYPTFNKDNIVGDRIVLSDMLFERGSSVLTVKCKNELDKMVKLLNRYKNLHIEIQGHVCCTPPNHKEAIDKSTKKRKLSSNRAENVYKYLIAKKVSKDRLTFKGYGNTVSLGKGSDLDRRVELVITKK